MTDKENRIHDILSMKENRRRFLQGLGATGAAALAGCTGGDQGQTATGSSNSNGTKENSGAGGSTSSTFRMNVVQRFGTIDPAKGTDYTQTMALVNLYDGLVFPNSKGELEPHIAKDWNISNGGKKYTFTLRDDVTFHSGNSLTASDVKFSFDRFLDLNQGYSGLFSGVLSKDNVTVKDDHTIEFTLDKTYSPFLAILTLLFIVDKKTVLNNKKDGDYKDNGDYGQAYLNNNDAGTGAYSLAAIERGSHLTFQKNNDYFIDFPSGAFDEVNLQIIKEDATVRSLMKTGKLDMSSQYQSQATYNALSSMNDVNVKNISTVTLFYLKLNTQRKPTDDIAVRKAIAYGFDYGTARSQVSPGSKKAVGPIAPAFDAHTSNLDQPTHNPQKAKQILHNAGYSDGDIKLEFTYVKSDSMEENMALLFQSNMQKIGIDVNIKPQTWGTMTQLASDPQKTPHVSEVFYGPVYPSPDAYFYNQYSSKAPDTWMSMEHLKNDTVDSLIEQSRSTTDQQKRKDIYVQLQQKIASLYPDVFVLVQTKKHAMSANMKGYTYRPAQSFDYWFHDYHHNQ